MISSEKSPIEVNWRFDYSLSLSHRLRSKIRCPDYSEMTTSDDGELKNDVGGPMRAKA